MTRRLGTVLIQEVPNFFAEVWQVMFLHLALPDDQLIPTQKKELVGIFLIADDVALQLRQPVVQPGLWKPAVVATYATMTVPKAAMHHYDLLPLQKYKIRLSGEIFPMQPIPESHRVEETPHDELRLLILRANTRHAFRPLLWVKGICHGHLKAAVVTFSHKRNNAIDRTPLTKRTPLH